jgi:hypothetical protein
VDIYVYHRFRRGHILEDVDPKLGEVEEGGDAG